MNGMDIAAERDDSSGVWGREMRYELTNPYRNITVDGGLRFASRNPRSCARLLAENLHPLLCDADWFTKEWQLKLCACLLQNLTDGTIETQVDGQLLDRIRRIPLSQAVKLFEESDRQAGLYVLVALICQELRGRQNLDAQQQRDFYNVLFEKFFPQSAASHG